MGDNQVTTIFSPERGQWILTDGKNYMEVPWWAHDYLRDEFERETKWLKDMNAKLQEACTELLKMAERHDPEWPHWPEMHEHLRTLGVEVE